MKIYGNARAAGPNTDTPVPVPTKPVRYRGADSFDPDPAKQVRSPIGPSTRTPADLAELEKKAARKSRRRTRRHQPQPMETP